MKTVSLEVAKKLKEAGWPQDKNDSTWVIRCNCPNSLNCLTPRLGYDRNDPQFAELFKHETMCLGCVDEGEPFVNFGNGDLTCNVREVVAAPDVSELLDDIKNRFNEIAIGWNDSGCFWHFRYGERGSGNMMEGFGGKFSATETENDSLADALANLWLELKSKNLL